MARLVLVIALFLIGAWFLINFGDSITEQQNITRNYNETLEMINNLEAPAAGGENSAARDYP